MALFLDAMRFLDYITAVVIVLIDYLWFLAPRSSLYSVEAIFTSLKYDDDDGEDEEEGNIKLRLPNAETLFHAIRNASLSRKILMLAFTVFSGFFDIIVQINI